MRSANKKAYTSRVKMFSSCQSVGNLVINGAEESFGLLLCLFKKKKKKEETLSRNVLNGWTQHLEISFPAQEVQGKLVSQNESVDNSKASPRMGDFTQQSKYNLK